MDDIHISRELYEAVERGDLPRDFLEEIQSEHLLARCPHCRAEAEAYAFRRNSGPSTWSRLLQTLSILVPRWLDPAERAQQGAQRDFEEILSLPLEARKKKLAMARSRFRSPDLVRLLLEESRRRLPGQPSEALHFAELAWTVANRNPGMPEFYDLYVLTAVAMGNAYRVQSDATRADELFALARQIMNQYGVTDPAILARVDDLVGSRRKDQRRLPEAERLLKRAAVLYGLAGSSEDHARVLIKLADTYCAGGSLDFAIDTIRTAFGLLGPQSDAHLRVCAHYNLTFYLASAGRFDEAADLLEVDEPLYRCFPEPWVHLRLLWLRADIAAGKGDLAAAERLYRETREGFTTHRMAYDAATVSLDLAILYLRQERLVDVQTLAEEMLLIFQAQDVDREILAALRLFQEAARRQELTVEKVREIVAWLRRSATDQEVSLDSLPRPSSFPPSRPAG
jgi:tetratricopeptide (TPR) repeat protein